MRVIEAREAGEILTAKAAVGLMREALAKLELGEYRQSPRSVLRLPGGNLFGFMPAELGAEGFFGAKLVTAFHGNPAKGLPSHLGYVMLFEAETGMPVAMVDAETITRVRTGAVSAVATDLLSRPESSVLALVGAGAQARSHLAAIREVRAIREARVFDLDPARAAAFAREASREGGPEVRAVASLREATLGADIVCTLTPSAEPYLGLGDLSPGAHVNAVGAFTPDKREVDSGLVAAAGLYADEIGAMKRECGEYLVPLAEGRIGEGHIRGTIGALSLGRVAGRKDEREITLFDALGLAVEDLACARFVYLSV